MRLRHRARPEGFVAQANPPIGKMTRALQAPNMIDHWLSALATAWIITFVATTGLVAALGMASVWDRTVLARYR